jgi:hypothetical protein
MLFSVIFLSIKPQYLENKTKNRNHKLIKDSNLFCSCRPKQDIGERGRERFPLSERHRHFTYPTNSIESRTTSHKRKKKQNNINFKENQTTEK